MKESTDSEKLHRRLLKIIGQVKAVDRMIDEDVPCEDVLSQISAAKAALNKAGQAVLERQIKRNLRGVVAEGKEDELLESFSKTLDRFANMQ